LDADFSSENFAESQYLFMHMDGQFDGEIPIRLDPSKMVVQFDGEIPIRLDPSKMVVVTTFETKIIGVIPYQNTITQSGFDFTNMMNEDSRCENRD
jgi:hypothetical protein